MNYLQKNELISHLILYALITAILYVYFYELLFFGMICICGLLFCSTIKIFGPVKIEDWELVDELRYLNHHLAQFENISEDDNNAINDALGDELE